MGQDFMSRSFTSMGGPQSTGATDPMIQALMGMGRQQPSAQRVNPEANQYMRQFQQQVPEIQTGYRDLMKPQNTGVYDKYVRDANQGAQMRMAEAGSAARQMGMYGPSSYGNRNAMQAMGGVNNELTKTLADIGMGQQQYQDSRRQAGLSGLSGLQQLFGQLGQNQQQIGLQAQTQNANLASQDRGNMLNSLISAIMGAGQLRQGQQYNPMDYGIVQDSPFSQWVAPLLGMAGNIGAAALGRK